MTYKRRFYVTVSKSFTLFYLSFAFRTSTNKVKVAMWRRYHHYTYEFCLRIVINLIRPTVFANSCRKRFRSLSIEKS